MRSRYVAYNWDQGLIKGKLEAATPPEAQAKVVEWGFRPLVVQPARDAPQLEDLFPSLFRVGAGDLIRFSRHLVAMLGSGGSLLRALEMLEAESGNRVMLRTLKAIRKTLDEGGSLSSALKEHPTVFSEVFVNVVEVGGHTGRLGPALDQMANIIEEEQEAKQRAIRIMMYPAAIIFLALITMSVLMAVALPRMLDVFQQMGADLPLVTRLSVAVFKWFTEMSLEIGVGVVLLVAALLFMHRIPRVRQWVHATIISLPVLGPTIMAGELSRFSRTFSMLLEAGVPLATALNLSRGVCKNLVLKRTFLDVEESLMNGHRLTSSLNESQVLPRMFMELVMIGEESNLLKKTMADAADNYQKQLDQRLNRLLGMLEPASTLVVGGIVALIAFSMFLPIYSGLNSFK